MALIKHGRLVDDIWHHTDDFADVQTLAPLGPVIVDLETWRRHGAEILALGGRIGLRLTPGQTPDQIAADLRHFDLIALEPAEMLSKWRKIDDTMSGRSLPGTRTASDPRDRLRR